jgi:hypothetical protein
MSKTRTRQQKNAGQKNEDQRALVAIFLPGIFLLSRQSPCGIFPSDWGNIPSACAGTSDLIRFSHLAYVARQLLKRSRITLR